MNFAELAIQKRAVFWLLVILALVGGLFSYFQLGRLEDPEFTIKEAVITTAYPGATPKEVEEEVTEPVETAIQQLGQLKRITSISQEGLSQITVEIKDKYTKKELPQIWDELRRKVNDMQNQLPPGAQSSKVNDDFGDVYGVLVAMTGHGYSARELKDYADDIKRQLLLVDGVSKVQITGVQQEQIFIEISRARTAQLGISLNEIYSVLKQQNVVTPSGHVQVGDEYIRIQPTGVPETVKALGNILLRSNTNKLIHLNDIATIKRGYIEVPKDLVYYNGEPAVAIGISFVSGTNVVKIGEAISEKMKSLAQQVPAGLRLNIIYNQPNIVEKSVSGFVLNVIEALAIVIVILLFFMGLRSGLIVGAILILTVAATLLLMKFYGIPLQRISLGALIIALGMMVDNAIVVVEGILVRLEAGEEVVKAAKNVVKQTTWPLLGATFVGIIAFAPIGLSSDSTGEYMASMFYVILISLNLSWFWAVAIAPLLCYYWMKPSKTTSNEQAYSGPVFKIYRSVLEKALRFRLITIAIMLGLLAAAVYGFGLLKPGFFPDSTTPMFYVDYWREQGADIRTVRNDLATIEKNLLKIDGVVSINTVVGQGAQRFTLVYSPERYNPSYSQLIVTVDDYKKIDGIAAQAEQYLQQHFPFSETKTIRVRLGPGGGAKIEARFSGPDDNILRKLSETAQDIMRKNPNATDVWDDWRQRVKVIVPQYSEINARRTGITRADMTDALLTAFSGKHVGIYREGDELIPIISRLPDQERLDIANIDDLQIWSPLLQKTVPLDQVVSGIKTQWEDAIIHRRDRIPTITVQCEPVTGYQAGYLFQQLRPEIEKMKLPAGYHLEWGGEYESSHDAQEALFTSIPYGIIGMFALLVLLFNSIMRAVIIWMCVPFAIIGVTVGLLLAQKPFEFVALLGFLSLSGMLIKNAVVLVDQIDLEIREGKPFKQAIIESSLSRMRPVLLASLTTVLGMIPLLFDAFFIAMAVTIIFGLTFATFIILILMPVLYDIFIPSPASETQEPYKEIS
ncbi:MAG: efflux RND transporter permease subunit [Gammaproteobacteria bacterium]